MAETARVTSIEAVKDFRASLFTFCEKARDGLCAVEMESRRTADWIVYDAPAYWQRALRERQEEVAQAQADLHRVKLAKSHGYEPDDIEQKQALAEAKRRVEEAEEKLENVKRWSRVVQRAVEEYLTRARRLADLVEGDPPPSVLFLDRVLDSLDAYLLVAPVHDAGRDVLPRSAGAASAATPASPSDARDKPTAPSTERNDKPPAGASPDPRSDDTNAERQAPPEV